MPRACVGFEIFDNNLFEQLCINYCNERLQAHFNQLILRIEQEEYRSEGIDVREVKFVDNIECVALIDARGTGSASGSAGSSSTGSGILALMDEELLIPRGSDATLLAKMHATFASKGREHPHYDLVRKRPECFVVKHYGTTPRQLHFFFFWFLHAWIEHRLGSRLVHFGWG